MNRTDLHQLADDRVADAAALLAAGRWSAAYYLAGYAVECALKACIAKRVRAEDFPDKQLALDSWKHDATDLARTAGLEYPVKARVGSDPVFKLNWSAVQEWDEAARYAQWAEAQARRLFEAVTDPQAGVLPWLKQYW